MAFEEWMALGGNEILNNARVLGYARSANCPMSWFKGDACDTLAAATEALENWDSANIERAPWYDPVLPDVSSRFYGAFGLSVKGIEDSTRTATVTEGLGDGGVIGRVRKAPREVTVQAILAAEGQDALEYGMAWLNAALDPNACGQHGDACGTADLSYFSTCPPEWRYEPVYTDWVEEARNRATNPSFEAAGAPVVVRTNLVTNPSYEATSAATTEIRRNLATHPLSDLATGPAGSAGIFNSQGFGTAGAGQYVRDTNTSNGPGNGITQWLRKTWFSPSTDTVDSGFHLSAPPSSGVSTAGFPVTAGQTQTFSYSVKVGSQTGKTLQLRLTYHDATGAFLSTVDVGPAMTPLQYVWERVAYTATHPVGAAFVDIVLDVVGSVWAASDELSVAAALIETAPSAGTYFDGYFVPASTDFTYAWTGAANASASVLFGTTAPGPSSPNGESKVLLSSEWARTGTKSVRIVPVAYQGESNNTLAYVNANNAMTFLTGGETYTVLAYLRLAAPQVGSLHANARSIVIAGDVSAKTEASPNEPGVYEHRLTFTVSPSADDVTIRLYNGASGNNGDVWWDDVLIVQGEYNGPYFDGSTPVKARRNLEPRPNATAALPWPAARMNLTYGDGYVRGTVNATGGAYFNLTNAVGRVKVSPGEVVTWSADVRSNIANGVGLNMYFMDAAGTYLPDFGQTIVEHVGTEWARIAGTFIPAPPGAAYAGVYIIGGSGAAIGNFMDARNVLAEIVPAEQPYFDGATDIAPYVAAWEGTAGDSPSYLTDPDFTYAWTSTAHASTSTQSGVEITGNLDKSQSVVAIQSSHWAASRSKSMREIPTGVNNSTRYADLSSFGCEVGKTYTAVAMLYMEAPQTGTLNARARSLSLSTAAMVQAPNEAGVHRLQLLFTVDGTTITPNSNLSLYNGSISTDVWWDDLIVIEGDYPGEYFDGTFPDADLIDYAWTGTPDDSESTYSTRESVLAPIPVEEFLADVAKVRRFLHDVAAISGPHVVQEVHSGPHWGALVEFVLVAGNPYVFGVMNKLTLPPRLPVVIADVPYNLVPTPSAELASGTVVVATNYATNPSAEVNATGWGWSSDGSKMVVGNGTIATSTELKANGTQSIKATYTAPATNTDGWFGTQQIVELPGITALTRYSVNMWAVASVQSGTAVLGDLEIHAYWQNAAGSTLRDDIMYKGVPAGGAATLKSVLPPPGTARVIMRAMQRVTSWNSGAVLRLYADALAVTNP